MKIARSMIIIIRRILSKFGFKPLISVIGESDIGLVEIKFKNYPFQPSIAFRKRIIPAKLISSIYPNTSPLTISVDNDLIFVSRELRTELMEFAKRNKIHILDRNSNWDYITEPFLDTEFTDDQKIKTKILLAKRGIDEIELEQIRKKISKQMFKYNSVLWEWVNLGLSDVLSSMRKKLTAKQFEKFYWEALEIEVREK